MSEDELAIRSVVSSWIEATQRGDVDAVLNLMTEDALFLVPGQPRWLLHRDANLLSKD